jgi:L-ascorbate metabolism protein UlaG (beta-lactamase superfamily)
MLSVKFLGHSCFTATDGHSSIIIDPYLTGNPKSPVTPDQIKVDAILVTHGHSDHLGDAIDIAKANNVPIIAVSELASYCRERGCKTHPLQVGGGYDFDFGRVKLTPALHGSSLVEDGQIIYLGLACGLVVSMGERTFYHAGDTGLFGDMKLIGELNNLELAMLPIGGNYTMDIDDAVIAARWSQAANIIPMHYDTFETIRTDPQVFADRLAEEHINCRILSPGETFLVP